jgi:hypothetical protein
MSTARRGRRVAAMKRKSQNIRVLLRGEEAGGITKADIERRARERALIRDGTENYTEADLEAAARELFGGETPASMAEDAGSEVVLSRDPSEPRGDSGHQRDEVSPDEDEENEEPERLAIQGVAEAEHDTMVQARRREQEQRRDEPA